MSELSAAVCVCLLVVLVRVSSAAENATVIAYVGMSASAACPAAQFDDDMFLATIAYAVGEERSKLSMVSYYPSSNSLITIVDFVALDTQGGNGAVAIAAKVMAVKTEIYDALSTCTIGNLVYDGRVVYTPQNISVVLDPGSAYTSRNPGSAPQVVMWLFTAIWICVVVAYGIFHILKVRHDKSLHYASPATFADSAPCVWLRVCGSDDRNNDSSTDLHSELVVWDCEVGLFASSSDTCMFTTAFGLYVYGDNNWGQLGLATVSPWVTCDPYFESRTSSELLMFRRAETSANHMVDITAGQGKYVCNAIRNHVFEFEQGTLVQIACGSKHTLFVTQSTDVGDGGSRQRVWACGSNVKGQLGIPREDCTAVFPLEVVCVPVPIPFFDHLLGALRSSDGCDTDDGMHRRFPTVVRVCCGSYHSVVLTTAACYVFGCGLDGQLLNGRCDAAVHYPLTLQIGTLFVPKSVSHADAGNAPGCEERGAISVHAFGACTAVTLAPAGATQLVVRNVSSVRSIDSISTREVIEDVERFFSSASEAVAVTKSNVCSSSNFHLLNSRGDLVQSASCHADGGTRTVGAFSFGAEIMALHATHNHLTVVRTHSLSASKSELTSPPLPELSLQINDAQHDQVTCSVAHDLESNLSVFLVIRGARLVNQRER